MHYRHGQPIAGTQYRFIRELGAGGHGTVYAVEHTFLEAPAVMKLLHAELVDRGDLAERMTREAKTLAKLRHPNIVEVRDGGITTENPPRPYFVMEALNGMPLRELLRHMRGARGVGVTPALRIMSGVLEGLEHAHRAGVIHRDIKPDNIFLHRTATDVTVPKVLDFGIAHLLMAQRTTGRYFLGTPRYAAPEQLRGDPPTPRTDIYAAGLLLWEMLTGEAPFAHLKEVGEILKGQLEEPLPFVTTKCPEAPPYLANFVAQMVAKNPDERPPTAFAAAVALREIRGRLEAKEARVLNNTGFKTEPTPMENMLFGATPHSAGVPTQPSRGGATPNMQSIPGMSGVVQDTIVDTSPMANGGQHGMRTTVRQAPRVVGGGVQHPMVVAETEVDTPRGGPSTPPMGGIDRSAKTNTSVPMMPPSRPNYDTERLLEGIADPVGYAETDAAPAAVMTPNSAMAAQGQGQGQGLGGGGEQTTGAIAMSRDPSMAAMPPREQVFKKQVIAFCVTLLVFAVISVPVLWKLKKSYGPAAQAPASAQPATSAAVAAVAPPPVASASAVEPAPIASAPPAPQPSSSSPPSSSPAPALAAPKPAPKPAATQAPPPVVAAPAPAPSPSPSPRTKPAATKPAPKPGDPSSVGFD